MLTKYRYYCDIICSLSLFLSLRGLSSLSNSNSKPVLGTDELKIFWACFSADEVLHKWKCVCVRVYYLLLTRFGYQLPSLQVNHSTPAAAQDDSRRKEKVPRLCNQHRKGEKCKFFFGFVSTNSCIIFICSMAGTGARLAVRWRRNCWRRNLVALSSSVTALMSTTYSVLPSKWMALFDMCASNMIRVSF